MNPGIPTICGPQSVIRKRIAGWLFDIDELGPAVTLWVYDDNGRLHRLTEEFHPPVYAHGERAKLKGLAADLIKRDLIAGVRWAQRREFWSGEEIEVLQLNVADSSCPLKLREIATTLDREISFYDLDIPIPQHYLYLKKLFPLCRIEADIDAHGNMIETATMNSLWEPDHPMPALPIREQVLNLRPPLHHGFLLLRLNLRRQLSRDRHGVILFQFELVVAQKLRALRILQ